MASTSTASAIPTGTSVRSCLPGATISRLYHVSGLRPAGSSLYLNDIAASVSQIRRALAPSAAGNTAIGWVGYSYRTPDAMADAGTRSGAAGRAELIKALTQPSQYDTVAPPVFADAPAVPGMSWKTQPIFGHLRGTAVATDG